MQHLGPVLRLPDALALCVMAYVGPADPEDHVFRDVGCMISHALQVAGDDHGIQGIAMRLHAVGHGKVGSLKDLPVQIVDQVVAFEHGVGQIGIGG